jgi:hypothetical protein
MKNVLKIPILFFEFFTMWYCTAYFPVMQGAKAPASSLITRLEIIIGDTIMLQHLLPQAKTSEYLQNLLSF